MNNQQKAYELKQTGLTYREVAKEMGLVSDESARNYARRYSGKKKTKSMSGPCIIEQGLFYDSKQMEIIQN
jgi:orotate phosphoribosyltransferase-like protein